MPRYPGVRRVLVILLVAGLHLLAGGQQLMVVDSVEARPVERPQVPARRRPVASVTIVQNGYIPSSPPAYAHAKTPYAASGSNNQAYIRAWMQSNGLVLTQNPGEDRKDFSWRQIKHILQWCGENMPWNLYGQTSDAATVAAGAPKSAIDAVGTKSTIIGGKFTSAPGSLTSVGLLVERTKTTPEYYKLESGVSGSSNRINCMLEFNGELIIGGSFTTCSHVRYGSTALGRIARWNGDRFLPFKATPSADFNNEVFAMAVFNGQLYVGGAFTQANGSTMGRITRWNDSTSSWEALPAGGGTNGFDNTVLALLVRGNSLWIGGRFRKVRGTGTHSKLTVYDGGSTSSAYTWVDGTEGSNNGFIGTADLDNNTTEAVHCLAEYGDDLAVGGSFLTVNGVTCNHVAVWDGSTWAALGTGVDSAAADTGTLSTTAVRCLTVSGSDLFAGGHFESMSGVANSRYVAKWNGSAWSALAGGFPIADRAARAFYWLSASELIVGSEMKSLVTFDSGNFAHKWDTVGGSWSTWISGGFASDGIGAFGEYRYHYSCGVTSIVAASLCQALGIPARNLGGIDGLGASDSSIEVYDARYDKWVWFLPHMNFWLENEQGEPLSLGELRAAVEAGNIDISYNSTTNKFTFSGSDEDGNTLVPMESEIIDQDAPPNLSISGWCPTPTNPEYPYYAGSGDGYLAYHVTVKYSYLINDTSPTTSSVDNWAAGPNSDIDDLRNIELSYPLNQLKATAELISSTVVRITLTHSMFDAPVEYEQSLNGGAWTPIALTPVSADVYDWTPSGDGATLMLRAVNAANQQSNDVSLLWSSPVYARRPPNNGKAGGNECNVSTVWYPYRSIPACETIASVAAFNAIPSFRIPGGRCGRHGLEVSIVFDMDTLVASPVAFTYTELFTLFQYVGGAKLVDGTNTLQDTHDKSWTWNLTGGGGQSQVVPHTWVQAGGIRGSAAMRRSIGISGLPQGAADQPVAIFPELPAGEYKIIWHATTAGLLANARVYIRLTQ